jgi:type I restriction enzyme S subunit
MSQVIPEQWAKATLDDIGQIQTGNTPSKKNPEYYGGLFPIFKPTDLNSTQVITKAGEYLSDEGKSVARRISANSTYVTCIGATIGKTGFVAVEGTCNQQINTISPYEGINPKWVYYWLISPNMNYEIISNSSSTTLPIINKSRFSNLSTLLPPLAEQKVIADKLVSMPSPPS